MPLFIAALEVPTKETTQREINIERTQTTLIAFLKARVFIILPLS
jgi:hypothetical protein